MVSNGDPRWRAWFSNAWHALSWNRSDGRQHLYFSFQKCHSIVTVALSVGSASSGATRAQQGCRGIFQMRYSTLQDANRSFIPYGAKLRSARSAGNDQPWLHRCKQCNHMGLRYQHIYSSNIFAISRDLRRWEARVYEST